MRRRVVGDVVLWWVGLGRGWGSVGGVVVGLVTVYLPRSKYVTVIEGSLGQPFSGKPVLSAGGDLV